MSNIIPLTLALFSQTVSHQIYDANMTVNKNVLSVL